MSVGAGVPRRLALVTLTFLACGRTERASKTTSPTQGPGLRLVIQTTWHELDERQTRSLTSELDDCFGRGFNLQAVVSRLPRDHRDTLRTAAAGRDGTWTLLGDEAVSVTLDPSIALGSATCSAPVKGHCPPGDERGPCRVPAPPTIRAESIAVRWTTNAGEVAFTGTLVATPERLTVTSPGRMPAPAGWSSWVKYSVTLDADGLGGTIDDTGCAPCIDHVQRFAAFPPSRSVPVSDAAPAPARGTGNVRCAESRKLRPSRLR